MATHAQCLTPTQAAEQVFLVQRAKKQKSMSSSKTKNKTTETFSKKDMPDLPDKDLKQLS